MTRNGQHRGVTHVGAAASLALVLLAAAPALGTTRPAPAAATGPARPTASAVATRPGGVVVATLNTGTNPFHPCFRRSGTGHPSVRNAAYPRSSKPLRLTLGSSYDSSLAASRRALAGIKPRTLYHVPGTNLSFYGGPRAATELVDDDRSGTHTSSQIGCRELGLAPDAQLLVLNYFDDPKNRDALVDWVVRQPWIDVVHVAAGTLLPVPGVDAAMRRLVDSDKVVVVSAGNGALAGEPSELGSMAVRGSLIVGANDNDGYALHSNLDPHVVMDGIATSAAAHDGFGILITDGTGSASARTAGYVARLLAGLRTRWGHTGTGLLTLPRGVARPASGPLRDGRLTAAELHEVVRRTADPNPHASRYDGSSTWFMPRIPQPAKLPFAFYPKMGYGEVSEHTLPHALAVVSGDSAMPQRPYEDFCYAASESLRQ